MSNLQVTEKAIKKPRNNSGHKKKKVPRAIFQLMCVGGYKRRNSKLLRRAKHFLCVYYTAYNAVSQQKIINKI